MNLDQKLDGVAVRDILAARELYTGIGHICFRAGVENGDTAAAIETERRIKGIAKKAGPERFERIAQYVIRYCDGEYRDMGPVDILKGLEKAASHKIF